MPIDIGEVRGKWLADESLSDAELAAYADARRADGLVEDLAFDELEKPKSVEKAWSFLDATGAGQ